jgi:hypothetical protein
MPKIKKSNIPFEKCKECRNKIRLTGNKNRCGCGGLTNNQQKYFINPCLEKRDRW